MSLSSAHLDAFLTVAQTASFSKAAPLLGLTQSGLSQKVKSLEEDLGLTLFIRLPTGVSLTEPGEKLLRYCQVRNSMEEELHRDLFLSSAQGLSGTLRIACYSSVFRSVIIPVLTPFLRNHPQVQIQFSVAKMPVLPEKLQRGETDFIVMDHQTSKTNVEAVTLGYEKYVLIQSKKYHSDDLPFLDNDANDTATDQFFRAQSKTHSRNRRRSYFDDCYGIIDGVAAGLGQAVMPEHLVKSRRDIAIRKGWKPILFPVTLYHHRQPFYSKLHQSVVEILSQKSLSILESSPR